MASRRGGTRDSHAFIGLGSNIEPERNLPAAVAHLSRAASILAGSSVYETPPVGPPGQPPFLNAAVLLATELAPAALKARVLLPIEERLGRRRGRDPYDPRPIDLDLLFYEVERKGERVALVSDSEILHHLHLALPLAELAPHSHHPKTGETFSAICSRLLGAHPAAAEGIRRREDVVLRHQNGTGES